MIAKTLNKDKGTKEVFDEEQAIRRKSALWWRWVLEKKEAEVGRGRRYWPAERVNQTLMLG